MYPRGNNKVFDQLSPRNNANNVDACLSGPWGRNVVFFFTVRGGICDLLKIVLAAKLDGGGGNSGCCVSWKGRKEWTGSDKERLCAFNQMQGWKPPVKKKGGSILAPS